MTLAASELSAGEDQQSARFVSSVLARDVALTQFSRAPMWLLGLD